MSFSRDDWLYAIGLLIAALIVLAVVGYLLGYWETPKPSTASAGLFGAQLSARR